MQLDSESTTAILNRAKRAHGHLGKVIAMLEEGADCEDVALQLAAVLKALQRTGFLLVATGVRECLDAGDGPESPDVQQMQKLFLSLA